MRLFAISRAGHEAVGLGRMPVGDERDARIMMLRLSLQIQGAAVTPICQTR